MRVSAAVFGSITSELYAQRLECLRMLGKGCTLASHRSLQPLAVMSKREACSIWLDDGTFPRTNLQNAFLGPRMGIACLVDCFKQHRPITYVDGRAYARHTPRARRHTPIDNHRGGGVTGSGCDGWLFVRHAPCATHPYVARGRVGHCGGLLLAVQGRDTGKPRPSKYISGCFLSFFSLCGCCQARRL